MIVVDTNILIAHFKASDPLFALQTRRGRIRVHPLVIGEFAMGRVANRVAILSLLKEARKPSVASDAQVLELIERDEMFVKGIGFIDAHLVAATRLTPEATLWTRDKRLLREARRLSIAFDEASA